MNKTIVNTTNEISNLEQSCSTNLDICKLLNSIDDEVILTEYYKKTIMPISDYDSKNNTELIEILKCYLKNDGSVNKTAEELHVHRNTINYKINKIEEICDVNLSSLNVRINYSIGLMLMNIIKIKEAKK